MKDKETIIGLAMLVTAILVLTLALKFNDTTIRDVLFWLIPPLPPPPHP